MYYHLLTFKDLFNFPSLDVTDSLWIEKYITKLRLLLLESRDFDEYDDAYLTGLKDSLSEKSILDNPFQGASYSVRHRFSWLNGFQDGEHVKGKIDGIFENPMQLGTQLNLQVMTLK